MAYTAQQISVSTSATPIVTPADNNHIVAQRAALVRNAGATSVWLGGQSVTTGTGLELPPGATMPIATTSPDVLYACAAIGSVRVDVLYGDEVVSLDMSPAGQQARTRALGVTLSPEDVALLDGSSITTISFTIPINTAISNGIDLTGKALLRLRMPAGWTAANLTVQTSPDNVTWNDLYDNTGVEYTIVAAASRSILIPPSDFPAMRWVRFRSGTGGAPMNQTAAATIDATVRVL